MLTACVTARSFEGVAEEENEEEEASVSVISLHLTLSATSVLEPEVDGGLRPSWCSSWAAAQ